MVEGKYKKKWLNKGKQELLMEICANQCARMRTEGNKDGTIRIPIEMVKYITQTSTHTNPNPEDIMVMGRKVELIK